jgi:hypothetical protein
MNDPTAPEDEPSQAQKTREEILQKRASRIEARAEFFRKIQDAVEVKPAGAIAPEEKEIVVGDVDD